MESYELIILIIRVILSANRAYNGIHMNRTNGRSSLQTEKDTHYWLSYFRPRHCLCSVFHGSLPRSFIDNNVERSRMESRQDSMGEN